MLYVAQMTSTTPYHRGDPAPVDECSHCWAIEESEQGQLVDRLLDAVDPDLFGDDQLPRSVRLQLLVRALEESGLLLTAAPATCRMAIADPSYPEGFARCDLEEGHDPDVDPKEVLHEHTDQYENPEPDSGKAYLSGHTMKWQMGEYALDLAE